MIASPMPLPPPPILLISASGIVGKTLRRRTARAIPLSWSTIAIPLHMVAHLVRDGTIWRIIWSPMQAVPREPRQRVVAY